MTYEEAFLPGSNDLPFYARYYHNKVQPCSRKAQVHTHSTLEISKLPECEAIVQLDDKTIHMNGGDIIIFRSNEQHFFTDIIADNTIITTGIHFFPEFLWSSSEDAFDMKYRQIFTDRNPNFINLIGKDTRYFNEINSLFFEIDSEFNKKDDNYALMIKLKLISLLLLVIRGYDKSMLDDISKSAEIDVANISNIKRSMKYINENLTGDLKLKQLAEIANMSTSYFSKLFKELNGVSTWDYIVSKRIEKAKLMLATTELPIYIISEQCGFNNTTNFYKAFNKSSDSSPKYYRQNK